MCNLVVRPSGQKVGAILFMALGSYFHYFPYTGIFSLYTQITSKQ